MNMSKHSASQVSGANRREFLTAGVGVTAAGLAANASVDRLFADDLKSAAERQTRLIKPGDTILFQGDSITDADRNRTDSAVNAYAALGKGYAWLAASQLLVGSPSDNLKIYNRGISGNKVYQLAERWKTDCLDLKPDLLSILIGVNDYCHVKKNSYDGTLEKYETDYRALVKRTRDALPEVRLVICEPFLLAAGDVAADWVPEFAGYRAAALRVAKEAGAAFVPFQAMFDLAVKFAPAEVWADDGIHPTTDAAALMAHWWLTVVGA
jgi:lysophospholipase L1-like esterase